MSEVIMRPAKSRWSQVRTCSNCKCVGRYFEHDVFLGKDGLFKAGCADFCGASVVLEPPQRIKDGLRG